MHDLAASTAMLLLQIGLVNADYLMVVVNRFDVADATLCTSSMVQFLQFHLVLHTYTITWGSSDWFKLRMVVKGSFAG